MLGKNRGCCLAKLAPPSKLEHTLFCAKNNLTNKITYFWCLCINKHDIFCFCFWTRQKSQPTSFFPLQASAMSFEHRALAVPNHKSLLICVINTKWYLLKIFIFRLISIKTKCSIDDQSFTKQHFNQNTLVISNISITDFSRTDSHSASSKHVTNNIIKWHIPSISNMLADSFRTWKV